MHHRFRICQRLIVVQQQYIACIMQPFCPSWCGCYFNHGFTDWLCHNGITCRVFPEWFISNLFELHRPPTSLPSEKLFLKEGTMSTDKHFSLLSIVEVIA